MIKRTTEVIALTRSGSGVTLGVWAASCLSSLEPGQRSAATTHLDSDILSTLRVLRACVGSYPELGGLIADALSILRRSVISCGVYGGPEAHRVHDLDTPTSHGRRLGESANFEHLYYITLAEGDLAQFDRSWARQDRVTIYFHEPLHYTGANNRDDHPWIESVPYDPRRPCAPNRLDDRIIFLQTLCGFPPRPANGNDPIEEIADRLLRCPVEGQPPDGPGGCLWMLQHRERMAWSDSIDAEDPHYSLRLFSEREAGRLCRRIIARTKHRK